MYLSGRSFELETDHIYIKPWNESIHARQSPVREWRDGCCRYNGTTLKLCTRVGRKTLLMPFRESTGPW